MEKITYEQTKEYKKAFMKNTKQVALQKACMKNGILASSENTLNQLDTLPIFSIDLETGPVANQKKSGRCWMFAALNTFRHKLLKTSLLKDFELSQNYTLFWDKYEKSNYFYNNIINTSKSSENSREVSFLLNSPQQDGGQWDMVVSLFQKYGVVPKYAMPETYNSSNTHDLNKYLNQLLRKHAIILRKMIAERAKKDEIRIKRSEMLQEVYNLLVISLGTPPESFDFEYRDSNKKYHIDKSLTPQSFYDKYIGIDLNDYVSVINAPTDDKPFMKSYTVDMLGNVAGGKQVKYLNLEISELKRLAIKQLEQGESVWFGCDVNKLSIREKGIMSLNTYDIGNLFDINFNMNKSDRLNYGDSLMTHAMVLTGVDLIDGQPKKWKVENSWGEDVGGKGFFLMTDEWLEEYTYQIVVRKELLTQEQVNSFEDKPIILEPWDPMGALA